MQALKPLLGVWVGEGQGQYPTIDSFRYSERLEFVLHPEREIISYEQRATLEDGTPSHWEAGVVRLVEDTMVEISNAQDSGRVEVLKGPVEFIESGLRLVLDHTVLRNDERMVQTRRVIEIAGDRLHYEVQMATTTTDEPVLQTHLEAKLTRQSSV